MDTTFKSTELVGSTLDKLFDKIEKQCENLNKINAEIIDSCNSIETTIEQNKQTADKLTAQVKEL